MVWFDLCLNLFCFAFRGCGWWFGQWWIWLGLIGCCWCWLDGYASLLLVYCKFGYLLSPAILLLFMVGCLCCGFVLFCLLCCVLGLGL